MRIINTKIHGILDYLVGAFLIVSPWILGIQETGDAARLLTIAGGLTIIYSLFTNYEAGIFKVIPMSMHLTIDLLSGLFIGIAPWALGFSDEVWLPHVLIGATEILVVVMTQPKMVEAKKARMVP